MMSKKWLFVFCLICLHGIGRVVAEEEKETKEAADEGAGDKAEEAAATEEEEQEEEEDKGDLPETITIVSKSSFISCRSRGKLGEVH